jgi:NADP-dependent 3-hydroxy acid dehydrogenase YdfG
LDQRDYTSCTALMDRVMEKFGRIDVLVNNAGGGSGAGECNFLLRDPKNIQNMIDTNLTGALFCSQAACRFMAEQGSGTIINLGSIAGIVGRNRDMYHEANKMEQPVEYAAAKGVRTTTENHGYIFQDPERVEELILAVGHENYGWLCDIGNFLCADCDIVRAVSCAAPYTYHVHVKDFLVKSGLFDKPEGFFETRGGNYLRGTVVGHGVVPVDACMAILKDAGYAGTLSLEFEGMEQNIPAIQAGYAYLRAVAERLA